MRVSFTKMQGAGNDFVVLDATRAPLTLSRAQLQRLGDRRFGVGADQILVVQPGSTPGVDFRYRIFNGASGDEVEHCGNGARCFVRYVRQHGLTDKTVVRVETLNNLLELRAEADGRVTVDMNLPVFEPARLPFDTSGLTPHEVNGFALWPLDLSNAPGDARSDLSDLFHQSELDQGREGPGTTRVEVAVVSMGNPHAVLRVDDVDRADVARLGPRVEAHRRFARKVNAGFMQIVSRGAIRLRVYERDAGETLACGTGACAAVVAGIRLGWLDPVVDVQTRGGGLTIRWDGADQPVLMTGPAETVFEGEIDL